MSENESEKRKDYLINKLFDLDESYLDQPLYTLTLVELERMHIEELNKTKHIDKWKESQQKKVN